MEAVALFALLPVLGALALATFLLWKLFLGLRWVLGRVFGFVGLFAVHVASTVKNMVVDTVHTAGALITAVAIVPLTLGNFLIGRWSAAKHYGRALEDEFVSTLLGVYRVGLSHPLRLVGLGMVLDGLERRIPDVVDRAPRKPKGKGGSVEFPGYDLVGTLPTGGSGAQLFLARPRPDTYARLRELGRDLPEEVVIKSFALEQGSTLPQIVRESRALEAANRLGLVYEHHLADDRFYYVTRYVEGDELDTVIKRLHGRSGPGGLGDRELALVLGYAQDLLRALDRFHSGGLWHKDVKPANLIVAGDRAHLVDFGLVTPLTSAMTLTTHGTEYYRDPEMVRLAMQGVKVHEVDGVKFDLYSAGAVLYSMVEDSFPAHGSLSQVTKRCPEALQYVIRRAMADVQHRYRAAWEMLDDLAAIAAARDPHALRPADLPSFRHAGAEGPERPRPAAYEAEAGSLFVEPAGAGGGSPVRPYLLAEQRRVGLPPDVRRKRRRRVVAAAGVVGLFFVGLADMIDERSHVHSRRGSALAAAIEDSPRLYAPERAAIKTAKAYLDEVSIDDELDELGERWLKHLDPVLPERRPELVSEPGLTGQALAGRRVMVLEDQKTTVDPAALAALEHALSKNGYRVVGAEDADVDIALVAGVRHAVGLGTPGDPEAQQRLQSFLDERDDLDAVLWVSSPEEDGRRLSCVLVRRDVVLEPRGWFELERPETCAAARAGHAPGQP